MGFFRCLAFSAVLTTTGVMSPGLADDEARVLVTVVAANSADSPLRIIGLKLPEKIGDAPKVIVENASTKHVQAFWVQVVVGRADGNELVNGIDGGPTIPERGIPPKAKAEAPQIVIEPHRLALSAGRIRSNCLHAAAIVTHVQFLDGTEWSLRSTEESAKLWKDSRPGGTPSCLHRPELENRWPQLQGSGYEKPVGTPTRFDPTERESFSFSCGLQVVKGKLVAACPF